MEVLVGIGYVLLLLVGFVLLVKGADFFVDGAAGIAAKLKVSSFIIGLTVVALGTSAPEAAVSVIGGINAAFGNAEGASVIMGNVLGSNMINILLILGISALIAAIPVEKSSRCIEIPFLIVISLLLIVLGDINDRFEWYDGLILVVVYGAFMVYTILMAKRKKPVLLEQATATSVAAEEKTEEVVYQGFKGFIQKVKNKYADLKNRVWFLIIITLVGLGMVVGGAQCVVTSAQYIAIEIIHMPTEIVALTVVAFGTSLPELVTSVSAARKGDMGIATGNIIGSNIANILFIAGLGFLCSGGVGVAFNPHDLLDGYMSIIAAVILLIFSLFKNHKLTKIAGSVMLVVLVAYFAYRITATVYPNILLEIPTLF